jgi:hypothetical protein
MEERMANNIVIVELQAIAGGIALAKRTLDDVQARVTANPGPQQDPAAQAALATIIGTSQLITQEAQQIQALPAGVPGTASSIEVKKDVRYLDDAARARLAEETLGMKLATYKYKNADERERLGFILEDSPNVPAADMSTKQVDLYAYASMVLATVQEQQKKIAALEAQIEQLKK